MFIRPKPPGTRLSMIGLHIGLQAHIPVIHQSEQNRKTYELHVNYQHWSVKHRGPNQLFNDRYRKELGPIPARCRETCEFHENY